MQTWLSPDTTNGGYVIAVSHDQRFQPHVMIGVDYYIKPKDTFPGAYKGWDRAIPGIRGGVAVDEWGSFFLGLAFEPVLGLNFSVGSHFGIEKTLSDGYNVGDSITVDQNSTSPPKLPTYDRRAIGLYFSGGFDLGIFSKIFGKMTGISRSD